MLGFRETARGFLNHAPGIFSERRSTFKVLKRRSASKEEVDEIGRAHV